MDNRLRSHLENPGFYPEDISGTIRDPYVFVYMIGFNWKLFIVA